MTDTAQANLRGKVEIRPLSSVDRNSWNPNRMTPRMKASLTHGLRTDGWIVSQALLIWGTDDKDVRHDIIIDGEHRWMVATELGMPEGPMVVLDGLTETQAKALTINMNQKRGEFVEDLLGTVLRELEVDLDTDDLALDLGFDDEAILSLLSTDADPMDTEPGNKPAPPPTGGMRSGSSHVKLVQLFFNDEGRADWDLAINKLAARYGTTTVTDTALEAVKRMAKKKA